MNNINGYLLYARTPDISVFERYATYKEAEKAKAEHIEAFILKKASHLLSLSKSEDHQPPPNISRPQTLAESEVHYISYSDYWLSCLAEVRLNPDSAEDTVRKHAYDPLVIMEIPKDEEEKDQKKGFVIEHLMSGTVSKVYATFAEAEEARLQQVEDNLSHDIGYLTEVFESEQCLSPADPDYEYLKAIKLNPGSIESIARQRGLDSLMVVPVEDEVDDE